MENNMPRKIDIQENSFFHDEKNCLMYGSNTSSGAVVTSDSYVKAVALVHDENGSDWKTLIEFFNTDGKKRELEISRSDLIDQKEVMRLLLREGFPAIGVNKSLLLKYLIESNPRMRIVKLRKSGWIGSEGLQYVCPSFRIVNSGKEYRTKDSFDSGFAKQGTLQEWEDNVAKYCYGNFLLVFSLCVSLSGVMLRFTPGINSTIFNLIGKSSIGKTTALRVAASVWGNKRFIQQWRATSNALEAIAESRNDNLLILDELSQSSGKDISETFYMLGNSRGKSRMKSDSTLRKAKSWCLMILSSGEVGIADKIEEAGGKVKAGQLVRAIDIDANVSRYGIFNCLHDISSGSDLSNLLNQNTDKYYGTVAEAFIRQLTKNVTECDLTDAIQDEFGNAKQRIYREFNLEEAHGQVQRVANVFALVETTGVSAVNLDVFRTTQEQIQESINFVFGRWLSERGRGAAEEVDIIEKLQDWILQNEDRFRNWDFPDAKVFNALGYKKTGQNEDKVYYVLPEAFRKEFCGKELGQSPKSVRKFLAEKFILKVDVYNQDEKITLPDKSRKRMTALVFKID